MPVNRPLTVFPIGKSPPGSLTSQSLYTQQKPCIQDSRKKENNCTTALPLNFNIKHGGFGGRPPNECPNGHPPSQHSTPQIDQFGMAIPPSTERFAKPAIGTLPRSKPDRGLPISGLIASSKTRRSSATFSARTLNWEPVTQGGARLGAVLTLGYVMQFQTML